MEIDRTRRRGPIISCVKHCQYSLMLIPNDSLLRRLPTNLSTRLVLFIDGITYSAEILDLAFQRLSQTLEKIASGQVQKDHLRAHIIESVSNAWVIIDSGHRLRELVQQLPGLKQKQPDVQLFIRKTSDIEDLRHYYQHFRTEIDSFVKKCMPLWGSIAWSCFHPETKAPETHTIIPGTFFHKVSAPSCVFDREEMKFVDRISLHAGPKSVDLADIHDTVISFVEWFSQSYPKAWEEEKRHGADMHLHLSLQPMILPQKDKPNTE